MRILRIHFGELVVAILLAVLLAAAAAFGLGSIRRPVPNLDGLDAPLANRQFDTVEKRLEQYLRFHPDSLQANMLMAQVALARDDQKPQLALRHLNRIRTGDRGTRAIVLLNEGKAYSALERYDRAESAWKDALRVEPRVPEAGWALLGLYYVQGRRADAHRLGLTLFASEPDPRDRAQLLVELLRQDAQTLGSDSTVKTFEPVVRPNSADLHSSIALGLALIRNSRIEDGLSRLRGLVEHFATNADAWDALLLGLDEARQFHELGSILARLPARFAADPRFDRYRGTVAQDHRDWPVAASAYLRAWQADHSEAQVLYRLALALRAAGRVREAEQFDRRVRAGQEAREQIQSLYEQANADKTLGIAPHPELYHRLADLRERMGREDEALAWHRLVLNDNPEDPVSKEASARLLATIQAPVTSHP
jgi:tetratricopeptide (TPR) repeat protein